MDVPSDGEKGIGCLYRARGTRKASRMGAGLPSATASFRCVRSDLTVSGGSMNTSSRAASGALSLWIESYPSGYTLRATTGPEAAQATRAELASTAVHARMSLPAALVDARRLAPRLDVDADWARSRTQPVDAPRQGHQPRQRDLRELDAYYDFADACALALTPEQRSLADPPLVESTARRSTSRRSSSSQLWVAESIEIRHRRRARRANLSPGLLCHHPAKSRPPRSQDTLLTSRPMPIAFVPNSRLPVRGARGRGPSRVRTRHSQARLKGWHARRRSLLVTSPPS